MSRVSLESLPDDVLSGSLLPFLSTFELLKTFVHAPPAKSWQSLWPHLACPSFEVDLEVAVAEATHGDADVARILNRKRADFAQIVRLVHAHSKSLQTLQLDNFGSALTDEIAPAVEGGTAVNVQALLQSHAHSLLSLRLSNCALRHLEVGVDFAVLDTLDLSKAKSLNDPVLRAPNLTALDMSRSLVADHELLRTLPFLPRLAVLRLIGCRNLRKFDGDSPGVLFGETVPQLKIVDISFTGVIDVTVNAITRYCKNLQALFLNDCAQLRQPRIVSNSLRTLSMKTNNRLNQRTVISCPALVELDLSKSNLSDSMVNSGRLHVPAIEVLVLKNCDVLLEPDWTVPPPMTHDVEGAEQRQEQPAAANDHRQRQEQEQEHLPPQVYPNLHTLDLSQCYGLSNRSFYRLCEMAPNLTSVNIQQNKGIESVWTEGDDPLAPERSDVFPSSLTQLRELCARGCVLTDDNVGLLLSSPSARCLEVLNLRNCKELSGSGLRGAGIIELDLRLTQLTDALLARLLCPDRCPSLKRLFVGQCERLVNPVLAHGEVEELDLSACTNLRTAVVAAPKLLRTDVSLCLALARVDLSACPAIRVLNALYSEQVVIVRPAAASVEEIDGSNSARALEVLSNANASAAQKPQEVSAAPRPLHAYSSAASQEAYKNYLTAQAQRQDAHTDPVLRGSGSNGTPMMAFAGQQQSLDEGDEESPPPAAAAAASFSIRSTASVSSPPTIAGSLRITSHPSKLISQPPHGARSSSSHNPHDSAPLHSNSVLLSQHSHRQQQEAHRHIHPVVGSPPKTVSRNLQQSSTSPPLSPLRRPAAVAAAAASAASSPSAFAPLIPPSPHRGIRSSDLCISEERVRTLEAKLATESAAKAAFLAADPANAGTPAAKDYSLAVYGAAKQLTIARAKLKKEQRLLVVQEEREREDDASAATQAQASASE